MKAPEEALHEARRRAAEQAAQSGAGGGGDTRSESVEEARRASLSRLAAWAVIEPEEAEVYSTRRLGAPITLLKRMLVRLLRQYLTQISAQQSRFNAHVAAHVISLEDRVMALEQAARDRRDSGVSAHAGTQADASGTQAGASGTQADASETRAGESSTGLQ